MSDTPRVDEAVDYASNFHPDCEVVNVDVAIDLELELTKIMKERDTLAEALRKCVLWAECMSMRCERDRDNINWSYLNDAREALDAVKGGPHE